MPVERVTDSMMAIVHALAESYEIVWIEFEFWKQVYWAHVVDFEFFFDRSSACGACSVTLEMLATNPRPVWIPQ